MKTAVRYYSRSGNTKKLADAIAKTLSISAATTAEPLNEPIDVLFLGGALYAGSVDKHLKAFVSTLTSEKAKQVAVFSNAAGPNTILKEIKSLLKGTGIYVADECFSCRGRFLLAHKNRPNEQDCLAASAFAKKMLNE